MAVIASVSGDVKLKLIGGAEWVDAMAGTRLCPQDRVWARSGMVEVHYDAGETMQLRPGTVVEIRSPVAPGTIQ